MPAKKEAPLVVQAAPESLPAMPISDPTRLIELAINQNADIEKLERLMDLQERWERNDAQKQFSQAFPSVTHHRHTRIKTSPQGRIYGSITLSILRTLFRNTL